MVCNVQMHIVYIMVTSDRTESSSTSGRCNNGYMYIREVSSRGGAAESAVPWLSYIKKKGK